MTRSTFPFGTDDGAGETENSRKAVRLICVGPADTLPREFSDDEVLTLDSSQTVLDQLSNPAIEGVWIARELLPELGELRGLCQSGLMLRDLPEGAALLDQKIRVLWANRRLKKWAGKLYDDPVGETIYDLLGNPDIMGSDLCPFHTALSTGEESSGTFQNPIVDSSKCEPRQ